MKSESPFLLETLPLDTGTLKSGIIYAANEDRFTAGTQIETLTQFASGLVAKDPVKEILDMLCPEIQAPRRFEYSKGSDAEAFLTEDDDVRAIGAAFKRVETRSQKVNASTQNKGLVIRLDKDGEGGIPGAQERAVERLIRRLYMNDFKRFWNLLVAATTFTEKTWNTSADPDVDLHALCEASGDARGIDPTAVLMTGPAWAKRIAALAGTETSGGTKLLWTPAQLAEWLDIDKIVKPKLRYQKSASTKEKAATGSRVIAYYVDDLPGLDSPTNAARFVTPGAGGMLGVYVQDFPKFIEVSVEQYSLVALPSTAGLVGYTIK